MKKQFPNFAQALDQKDVDEKWITEFSLTTTAICVFLLFVLELMVLLFSLDAIGNLFN